MTMEQLEKRCAVYDQGCDELEAMIAEVEADLADVKRKHLAGLKQKAASVAARHATLLADLEASPELFVKPRTAILHGVKIGFTTGKGRVEFDDPELVLRLIAKHQADRRDELVRVKEEPNKDALKNLSREELQKLACRWVVEENIPVLARVAGDMEKLIGKLIEKMVEAMVEPEQKAA